jgi:sulfur-carrier protein
VLKDPKFGLETWNPIHKLPQLRNRYEMVIKVKYFGMVAEAVGQGQEEIVLPSSELDLRQFFVARYPRLQAMTWKLAVDQELIEGIVVMQDHAEVVLLPPFAGG